MYELTLTSGARRDLKRLDSNVQRQIFDRFTWLCENCDRCTHKALKGRFKGKFSLKSGNYRIIYTFNRQTQEIEVSQIEKRSSVYNVIRFSHASIKNTS